MEYTHLSHTFEPIYNEQSKILILGTFPSVKSREYGFYYGHPMNRFWKLLGSLMKEPIPITIEEKKQFLLKHNIAIWDVVESCDIIGSSDSSIKNVVPTDINRILDIGPIEKIYANGTKAFQLYNKYTLPITKREIIKLPSTSPANAMFSFERLVMEWEIILE